MCKYCDGRETPLASEETDNRDAEIRIDCNALIADLRHDYLTAEIAFCPMCGTPLGEVKPLTVEQLRVMSGKPVWIKDLGGYCTQDHWVIFWVSDFDCDIEKYGITWFAFDREPKGDAEWVK